MAGKTKVGAGKFQGIETLRPHDLWANIVIEPWNETYVEVVMEGKPEDIETIKVEQKSGTLQISGGSENQGSVNVSGNIFIGSISMVVMSSLKDLPTVTIRAPRSVNFDIANVYGDGQIGDFDGLMKIEWDSVKSLNMGNVRTLDLHNSSVGDVKVGNVTIRAMIRVDSTGDVEIGSMSSQELISLSLTSVGSLTVKDISCPDLTVEIGGTGDLSISEVRVGKRFTVTSTSVGAAEIEKVSAIDANVRMSGTGDVEFHSGEISGQLTVNVSSVGSFSFDGKAQKASLIDSGVGDINVDKVVETPLMRSSSVGEIEVSNWS